MVHTEHIQYTCIRIRGINLHSNNVCRVTVGVTTKKYMHDEVVGYIRIRGNHVDKTRVCVLIGSFGSVETSSHFFFLVDGHTYTTNTSLHSDPTSIKNI